MENITNQNEQQQQPDKQEEAANETDCHLRNLILNANLTITTAAPQLKCQNQTEENKEEKDKQKLIAVDEFSPVKKQKLSFDFYESTLNPLASLPVSLISNGTLSVTSKSACVAIENGVPILKEGCVIDKSTNILSNVTKAPVLEIVSTKTGSSSIEKLQRKYQTNNNINENSKESTLKRAALTESNDSKKSASKDSLDKIILKALTDVGKRNPASNIGFIPSPNQMDFLTLLGLETVVDSCCPVVEVPKYTESFTNQTPLICGQCQVGFTKNWHFYKCPLQVLCDYCFQYNDHQILKAAQTVRIAKEYTKTFHLKQKSDEIKFEFNESVKMDSLLAKRLSTQELQNEIFQNYMNAAGIYKKDNDCVSDLTRLGAWIASNSDVFEAAKAVNSLESNATPLLKAKAVQNFQITLFKALHEKLSSSNSNDFTKQKQSLLQYQMTIAQMEKQANLTSLQSENQIVETPLNGIVRAIKAQHHSLVKTILKQVPKSADHGVEFENLKKDS